MDSQAEAVERYAIGRYPAAGLYTALIASVIFCFIHASPGSATKTSDQKSRTSINLVSKGRSA